MHVFMQFEQFCSKDFRDTSNLILNWSKLGPITLYNFDILTLYLQYFDCITFVKATIVNLILQLDDSGDILQINFVIFGLYLLLNKSFKVQMVVRACWQILWVTNYQIKDDNLKWHCKIHSKRLNIKFKDPNL